MRLRSVVPEDGIAIDLEAVDARTRLLALYKPLHREVVRLNLVTTLDGRAAGADGTSNSLTSRLDRLVLGVIRELSDVVLVGAGSLRREGYVRPRAAALAVLSASGDLRGHRIDGEAEHPLIVLTTEAGAEAAVDSLPTAEIVTLPSDEGGRVSLAGCIQALRDRGLVSIVAEGGPEVAAQLIADELVDELCLTVMPRVGGPALPVFSSAAMPISTAVPHRLLVGDDGVLFGRWLLNA